MAALNRLPWPPAGLATAVAATRGGGGPSPLHSARRAVEAYKIVVAVDFGTHGTGLAFKFSHNNQDDSISVCTRTALGEAGTDTVNNKVWTLSGTRTH